MYVYMYAYVHVYLCVVQQAYCKAALKPVMPFLENLQC